MADHVIAARSERAVRCAASRWGLALGIGSPSASFCRWQDRLALECAVDRVIIVFHLKLGQRIIAADVTRFDHVINKDGVLGTHRGA